MSTELNFATQVLQPREVSRTEVSQRAEILKDERDSSMRAAQAARQKFVEDISKSNGLEKGRLVIEKDSETGKFIHKLVDPNTGEVVRQWPDESWLEFAKMHGAPNGLWVNQTA